MAQQEHGEASTAFWWTHRLLAEEAALLPTSSTAEGLIHASIDGIKERARALREMANTRNQNEQAEGREASLDVEERAVWHEELVAVQNQLLKGLVASQHEQQLELVEEVTCKESVVSEQDMSALQRTAHEMVLSALFGEWASLWVSNKDAGNSNNNNSGNSSFELLVDMFLDDMAFTFVSKWVDGSEESATAEDVVRDVVWSFVTDTLSMTPIEQERLLPRLTQHAWEALVLELQNAEEEVLRLSKDEVSDDMPTTAQERQNATFTLAARLVRVLKMLAFSSTTSDAAVNRVNPRGHIVLVTSAKAQTIVQSMGRWLPVCGKLLYSLAPRRQGEKNIRVENGGNNNENEANVGTTTHEALDWIRRLRLQAQRVVLLLAEMDETSPWIVPLADVIARTFYMTSSSVSSLENDSNSTNYGPENDQTELKQHEALKLFLTWYSTTEEGSPFSSSTSAAGAARKRTSQRSLVEACGRKMGHVLSSALDRENPPSSLNTRVLRVLLVQRPLATLRHFLNFLCPCSNMEAFCDFDVAITNKGRFSELRSNAFKEDPLKENTVAWTFFPKYFAVFCAVEEALVSLGGEMTRDGAMAADAASLVLERFLAAALDDVFLGFAQNKGTAASEWLMFLAFLCSETPMFEMNALQHVRNAARRFFAPGKSMILYLHRHIVQLGQHGLVAFFLPPLRAIGIDYSTAADHEHVSCALRYPLSAEVAYFQELPHGYYCRQPLRLALNAKNDALRFFHELIMPPSTVESSKKLSVKGSMAAGKEEDERAVTRGLFVDIVAHVGVLISARVRGDSDHRVVTDPVTLDAMSSFFFGLLRLCSNVTYWDDTRRHDIQRAIVQKLCLLSEPGLSHPVHVVNNENNNGNKRNGGDSKQVRRVLPLAFLLRGGCTLNDAKVETSLTDRGNVLPHAWRDWFFSVELEDFDSRAVACAMALLRICNRDYMKSIPTRTLLAQRSILDKYATKEKDVDLQAQATAAMRAAIQRDVDMLREEKNGQGSARPKHKQDEQPSLGERVVAVNNSVVTETGVDEKACVGHGAPAPVGPAKEDETKGGDDEKKKEEARGLHHNRRDEKPLPLSVVKPYIEKVVATLIQRARMSVVDGVATGLALKKWLLAVAGQFEPTALLETVRHVVLQANTKLTHATKLECASLSAFLGVIADDIALPYKLSFSPSRLIRARQQQQQSPLANDAVETENKYEWSRRVFPVSEKDATMLLRLLIADTTRAVTHFLDQSTPLGDWKAYTLTFHLRHIMGLVKRYADTFRAALAKREKRVGATVLTGEGAHPVQLLGGVQCPLLPNMAAAAADVEHLFNSAPSTRPAPTLSSPPASGAQKSATDGGGGDGERGAGDALGRKRHRSTERFSSHHRRGRRRHNYRNHND